MLILPVNLSTISKPIWPLKTIDDIQRRLEHLRRLDTLQRQTCCLREAEKNILNEKVFKVLNK